MIQRLQISGIRSFSPNSEISIDFDQKLTIIIGKNGAGKSTILECLKFAVTGVYPPGTDNGRCFIHDPKLHNRSELTAYIRLSFLSADQNEFKVSRAFFLTRKNEKLEIRKSENLLHYYDTNGSEVQKSMRVNELDNLIPQLFSLNPAILQYVCFCHQDDSFWPFGESSLLKKVFDQIFCTEEYSKAQEHIRKFLKDRKLKLSQIKEKLNWEMKQVRADREIREKIKACKNEVKDLEDQKLELENDEIEADKNFVKLKETENLIKKVEVKQKELEMNQGFLNSLGEISEFSDDESSIEMEIEKVNKRIKELEGALGDQIKEFKRLDEEVKVVQVEKVQVETQIEMYKDKMRKEESGIVGFGEISEETEDLQELMTKYGAFKEEYKKKKEKLKNWRKKIEAEISRLKFELEKNHGELAELKKTEESLNDSKKIEDDIEFCERNIESCKEMIENEEINIGNFQRRIAQEHENKNISLEVQAFNQEQRLKSVKLQETCSYFVEISKILPETTNLSLQIYESHLKSLSSTLLSKKVALNSSKNDLDKQIKQLKTEEISNIKKIVDLNHSIESIKKDQIDQAKAYNFNYYDLEELEKNVDYELAQFKKPDNKRETYLEAVSSLIDKSRISKKCKICENPINDNVARKKFEKIGRQLAQLQNKIGESEKKGKKLFGLSEKFFKIKELYKEVKGFEDRNKEINDRLMENHSEMKEAEKELEEINSLSEKVFNVFQLFPQHFNTLTSVLCQSGEITLFDLRSLQFSTQSTPFKQSSVHLAELEAGLEQSIKERDSLATIRQNYSTKLQSLHSTLETTNSTKSQLVQKSKELTDKNIDLDVSLSKHHDSLHIKLEKYTKILESLKTEKSQIKQKLSLLRNLKAALDEYKDSVKIVNSLVLKHESIESSQKILIQSKQNSEKNLNLNESEAKALESCLEKLNKKFSLIQKSRASKEIQVKISTLTSELSSFGPVPKFNPQTLRSSEELIQGLRIKKAKIDQSILLKTQELNSLISKSPNSEESAISLYTEVQVLEKAIEEQSILLKALEASIINYHRQKIFEVNHIISKLWAETYKGNDIEKILIGADIENNSKKSNFNYRICFLCKGQEIDMRGRCSSGQRMMASLVIRIALAQAFSGTFSVIALDEPTTNMDAVNAEGLAECIAQISAQFEKLQIILITHDNDFMRKVIRESPRESYLMVEKLKNSSIVTKIKVS